MKWRTIITGILFMMSSVMASAADVFGLSPIETQQLIRKYGKSIEALQQHLYQFLADNPYKRDEQNSPETPDSVAYTKQKNKLMERIKKENGFLYVHFDTIVYPGKDKLKMHSTLEIIDKNHPERMRFVKEDAPIPKPSPSIKHPADVIESMIKYQDTQQEILLTPGVGNISAPCPVYHCLMGFAHPRLKPYLNEFNEAAVKQKPLILSTIKSDPSPARRGAAIFLVGHFQNPTEIITILLPYVNDSDRLVRNNVMRVIGETVEKSKIADFDLTTIHPNLTSPYTSDRNKALYVLYEASKSKQNQPLILKNDGTALLEILRLEQPNNHRYAYLLLKKLSGKDFGSTNVPAWSKWMDSALNVVA